MADCRIFPAFSGNLTVYGFGGIIGEHVRTVPTGDECLLISANGYPTPHPFEVNRTKNRPPVANGFQLTQSSQPTHGNSYVACPEGSFTSGVIAREWYPAVPNGAAMAARLLAGTNPTRPAIRLPVSLFELREIPMMYHQALSLLTAGRRGDRNGRYWKNLSPTQRLASANLATQFGWLPMIRDVQALFSLPETVSRRQKEWDRLYDGNGLKRRMTLHSGEANYTRSFTAVPSNKLRTAMGKSSIRTWGTVRWKPVDPSPNFGRPADKDVRKMLLGLTAGDIPANLWNALPWSWLVDWFTNVGDILQANQGRGYAYPTGLCVMHYRRVLWTFEGDTYETTSQDRKETVTISSGECQHENKMRVLPSATLTAEIPILGSGSLSILGSLAVSQGRFSSRTNPGLPRWRPGSLR